MKDKILKKLCKAVVLCVIVTMASGCGIISDLYAPVDTGKSSTKQATKIVDTSADVKAKAILAIDEESFEDCVLTSTEIATLSRSVLTVYVYNSKREQIKTGSGFIAFNDSTIVTNNHVIENGVYVEVVSEDDVILTIAGILHYDVDSDIAILKTEAPTGLPVLKVGDSDHVQVGDTVYAIGSPYELKNTVSNGIISAIRNPSMFRDVNNVYDFQTTASISPGSSGGALLNEYGEIIGVTTAQIIGGQNLNFAIPSSELLVLESFDSIILFEDIFIPPPNVFERFSPDMNINCITFTPHRVWYENGDLIAEMFIHNGYPSTAYNIREILIEFQNEDGVIAEANFGAMQNACVGSGQYIIWTFTFGSDCVSNDDADLTGWLRWRTSSRYNY